MRIVTRDREQVKSSISEAILAKLTDTGGGCLEEVIEQANRNSKLLADLIQHLHERQGKGPSTDFIEKHIYHGYQVIR